MSRFSCFLAIAVLATIAAGCGNDRATKDIDTDGKVRAINFEDGTTKTFASESEVPEGWGVCPDNDCGTVPAGVPCQNLGEEVCEKNPACRLRDAHCSSPGWNPDSGEAMPDPTDVECEKVCVPKGALQCDEIGDQQSCADRSDCEWGPNCETVTVTNAPCYQGEDGETNCVEPDPLPCPEVCHPKQPPSCEDLDEQTCNDREDCSWSIMACPAIGCLEAGDPACECKPFCQPTPPPPQKGCSFNGDCSGDQYCFFEQGLCGVVYEADTPAGGSDSGSGGSGAAPMPEGDQMMIAPSAGVCKDRPQECTLEYGPVCGCDGKEYSNACMAASAGVNVMHGGPCDQPPPPPGESCTSDADCATADGSASYFCAFKTGACMFAMPMIDGVCTLKPEACYELYAPVCGCDGKTYGNECEAQSNGVNIAQQGECSKPTPCVITGCSGEICAAEPMASTCVWLPEYACLVHTTCGLNADGSCGWEQNQDYLDCVAQAKQ